LILRLFLPCPYILTNSQLVAVFLAFSLLLFK
jgi:hypothetical protein